MSELVAALRAPSFQQDSQWHHPKANYATKPRDLLDAAAARIEALEAALQAAAARLIQAGDWLSDVEEDEKAAAGEAEP